MELNLGIDTLVASIGVMASMAPPTWVSWRDEGKLSNGKHGLEIDAKLLQNAALHFNNADFQHDLVFARNFNIIVTHDVSPESEEHLQQRA